MRCAPALLKVSTVQLAPSSERPAATQCSRRGATKRQEGLHFQGLVEYRYVSVRMSGGSLRASFGRRARATCHLADLRACAGRPAE